MTATTTPAPSPTQTAECVETSLNIGGMTCASCVRRVEKTLTRVHGVAAASGNLANQTATVSHHPPFPPPETLTPPGAQAGDTPPTDPAPVSSAPPSPPGEPRPPGGPKPGYPAAPRPAARAASPQPPLQRAGQRAPAPPPEAAAGPPPADQHVDELDARRDTE